eukprot:15474237-Alexandrium_andersonii.AAC.1
MALFIRSASLKWEHVGKNSCMALGRISRNVVDTPAHCVEELETIRTPLSVYACGCIRHVSVRSDTVHDQCLASAVVGTAVGTLVQKYMAFLLGGQDRILWGAVRPPQAHT